jgi:putative oxidoreductase
MTKILFTTDGSLAPLITRIVLGICLFPHGAQKMLGWFGGYGFSGTLQFFTQQAGLPWVIGLLVILIEFFGALFLLAGFLTRLSALLIIFDMVGIIWKAHFANGFFMNWFGNQAGEGYEYHLLVIGLAISLLITGGGKASIDHRIVA